MPVEKKHWKGADVVAPTFAVGVGRVSSLRCLYADVSSLNMAAEKTTTVRLDGRMLKRVDEIARAMSRPRAWVISQAIERYLDYEEWFVAQVEHGLKEAERGQTVDHRAVLNKWTGKRAAQVDSRR